MKGHLFSLQSRIAQNAWRELQKSDKDLKQLFWWREENSYLEQEKLADSIKSPLDIEHRGLLKLSILLAV